MKPGFLKRSRAFLCHHCPVCRYGRRRPDSLLGRMLHHPLHAEHCPLWRAEREIYGRREAPSTSTEGH